MIGWLGVALAGEPGAIAPSSWVDIDNRLLSRQTAPGDVAVVIGLEDYLAPGVPDVPFARRDAEAFYSFLLYTRGVPMSRIRLMKEGNREQILEAVREAADDARDGTVWFYFAGHGAAGPNSGERLLLGDDARTDSASFEARSVPVSEIERAVGNTKLMMVLDVCYTGYGRGGAQLGSGRFAIPQRRPVAQAGRVQWTATEPTQIAFPLATPRHGAFTYFAIGAMRGWADGELGAPDGKVTGDEAQAYVRRALAKVQDQPQSPEWVGPGDDWVLSTAVGEIGPPLEPVVAKVAPPILRVQPEQAPPKLEEKKSTSKLDALALDLTPPDPDPAVDRRMAPPVAAIAETRAPVDPAKFRSEAALAWPEVWSAWAAVDTEAEDYDYDAYQRRSAPLTAYVDRWYDPEIPVPEVDVARAALAEPRFAVKDYRTAAAYERMLKRSRHWGRFPLSVLTGVQASGFGGVGYGSGTAGVGGAGLRLTALVVNKPLSFGIAGEGTVGPAGPSTWWDLQLHVGEEIRGFVGAGGGVQGLGASPIPLVREVVGLDMVIPIGDREPETGCLTITPSVAQHQLFGSAGIEHVTQASIAVGWAASPWPRSF